LNNEREDRFSPELPRLVQVRNNEPIASELSSFHGQSCVCIEIPADINSLQLMNPQLAFRWRETTRGAFAAAIAAGYLVEDFFRSERDGESFGVYVLSAQKKIADVS
jgi:predicted GNAT superfamily acetyltransferase